MLRNVLSSVHNIVWKILGAGGTLLRQGTGWNVDFDNLPYQPYFTLSLAQGAAPPRTVTVNAIANISIVKPVEIFTNNDDDNLNGIQDDEEQFAGDDDRNLISIP